MPSGLRATLNLLLEYSVDRCGKAQKLICWVGLKLNDQNNQMKINNKSII